MPDLGNRGRGETPIPPVEPNSEYERGWAVGEREAETCTHSSDWLRQRRAWIDRDQQKEKRPYLYGRFDALIAAAEARSEEPVAALDPDVEHADDETLVSDAALVSSAAQEFARSREVWVLAGALLDVLPEAVRAYRAQHGLTTRQFADRAGVAFSTVSRVETRGGDYDVSTARAMIDVLTTTGDRK